MVVKPVDLKHENPLYFPFKVLPLIKDTVSRVKPELVIYLEHDIGIPAQSLDCHREHTALRRDRGGHRAGFTRMQLYSGQLFWLDGVLLMGHVAGRE